MNDHIEVLHAALEDEGRAITAARVTLFGRECYLPADIAQEVEQACVANAQQPAAGVGEEIMVNAAHGVFTLPLQPSGLSSGPRFVVHVPAPEQQPAAVDALAACLVDELDGLVDESYGVSGLHLNGDVATWDELLPGGRFERLSSLDELRAALAAQQQQTAAMDEAMVERMVEAFLASTGQQHSVTQLQRDLTTKCMKAALAALTEARNDR